MAEITSSSPEQRAKEFQRKVADFIRSKLPGLKCPLCGGNCLVGDTIGSLTGASIMERDAHFTVTPDAQYAYGCQLIVALKCKPCGYLLVFSADEAIAAVNKDMKNEAGPSA